MSITKTECYYCDVKIKLQNDFSQQNKKEGLYIYLNTEIA